LSLKYPNYTTYFIHKEEEWVFANVRSQLRAQQGYQKELLSIVFDFLIFEKSRASKKFTEIYLKEAYNLA